MIKTFCITLKTTPERKAKAAEHFAERGLIDVTFFEGIDNRAFGLKSTIKDMSPGQVGCILSHYMLWQTMTHMEGFTEAVVLEDDVRLHNDFADEVRGIQKYAPKDWEFIYLGHCFPTFDSGDEERYVKPVKAPLCTHAYMLKTSALPILLETNHIASDHIDLQLQYRTMHKLNFYVLNPPVASQVSRTDWNDPVFKSLMF